jgi:hypothetical protein
MKKFIIATMLILGTVSSTYGGECVSGNCSLRSRVVNVTREVISVPVTVTRRTVEATRNFGRKSVNRVRSIVR